MNLPEDAPTRSPTTTFATTQEFKFEDKNYSIRIPGLPWLISPGNIVPKAAQVGFYRVYPPIFFIIIGERLGVETPVSNDDLATIVINNMKRVALEVTLTQKEPMRINGLDGLCLHLHAKIGTRELAYENWVCATHGYLYQLAGSCHLGDEQKLHELLPPIRAGFKQLSPDRLAHAPGAEPFTRYVSHNFGFTIDFADPSRWHSWPNIARDMPSAETGAVLGNNVYLSVVPIDLPDEPLELETIVRGFLGILNVQWEAVNGVRRVTDGPLDGYVCDFNRVVNGLHVDYHFKIVRGQHFAYLVATWTTDASLVPKLADYAESVKPPTTQPAPLAMTAMNESQRRAHVRVYDQILQQLYLGRDLARAGAVAHQLTQLAPDEPSYAAYEVQMLIEQGDLARARECAMTHLKRLPDAPGLLVKIGTIEKESGHSDLSIAAYKKAFVGNYENDVQFLRYVEVLSAANKIEDALAVVEAYLKHSHAIVPLITEARLLSRKGEHDRAIDLLKRKQDEIGMNAEVTGALAEMYINAGRFNEGLDIAKQLIGSGFGSADVYYTRARAEVGQKWYRDAQTSLETALRKDPNFPQARDLLNYVTGMLGQGDSSSIREAIEPVKIPDELLKDTDATTQPATTDDYGAVYVKRIHAVHFEPSKDARTTDRRVIRIVNRRGVQDFSSIQFTFDPLSENIYVNELVVRDEKNAVLFTGKSTDYYVVDQGATGAANQRRILNIPVSGLRPGCTIDLTVTRKDRRPTDQIVFDEWTFPTGYPVAEAALFVSGDLDAIRYRAQRVAAPRKMDGGLCWSMHWPTPYKWEPSQQDFTEFLPYVVVAPSKATWESEGQDYLNTIGALLAPTDEAKHLAAELTDGLTRPQEKVAAILRHLQQDYTYKAIEFGRRARIPSKTSDIIRNRYGDCKDHSLLLAQLLESSGIPAQLALAKTVGVVYEDLPSLDQFNHVIVYAPTLQRFFDCTDKDTDLAGGVPYGLGGRKVLLLDNKSPHLATIPEYANDSSTISTQRDVRLLEGSDVELRDHLSLTGYCAGDMRAYLRNTEPRERAHVIEQMLSRQTTDLSVRDLQVKNLDEPNRPLLLDVTCVIRRRFTNLDNQITGSIPAMWERSYLHVQPLQRETPFIVRMPLTVHSTITIAAPEKMHLPAPPKSQSSSDTFTDSQITYSADASGLRCDATIHLLMASQPADRYEEFRQSRDKLLSELEPQLLLKGEPNNHRDLLQK